MKLRNKMYFIIFISSFAYLLEWKERIGEKGREQFAVCRWIVGICRFSCFKLWYYYLCILFKPSIPSQQNGLLTMHSSNGFMFAVFILLLGKTKSIVCSFLSQQKLNWIRFFIRTFSIEIARSRSLWVCVRAVCIGKSQPWTFNHA